MDARSYGAVFDKMAVEYDRLRPTYPDELIGRFCDMAALAAGDRVLEIGCGTGQLTGSLVARGLRVTAVEPGRNLIELAGRGLTGSGAVEFVNHRFEDAPLGAPFPAAFSASAFHWIDPDVSWGKVASSLAPAGRFALIQYCGVRDEEAADDHLLLEVLASAAPPIAEAWPPLRDLETILTGAQERRSNVSELWAWVGGQDVARDYAAGLFDEVEIAVVPARMEQTAQELNALLGTTSLHHRLSPAQRDAIRRGVAELEQRIGRPIRSRLLGVLVTARRAEDRL